MTIKFANETRGNESRAVIDAVEARSLRTFTPSMAVIERSSGLFHYTNDGRKLADFTSGVLVTNLGHHPKKFLDRLRHYLDLPLSRDDIGEHEIASAETLHGKLLDLEDWKQGAESVSLSSVEELQYETAPPWTAYNAITVLEQLACERLLASLQRSPLGKNLQQILWSASGSEGIQKALWSALKYQPNKDIILATRDGFHGKKGLSEAVTGNESSPNRDPRVKFISFPKKECYTLADRARPMDVAPYLAELDRLAREFPGRINCLITEPYLGGGGSFHPPKEYLPAIRAWCAQHDVTFILDEVQSNFGRTGNMYAFETYSIDPDMVVLGKGMGNGVPVNAVVGRRDILSAMGFGDGSDTWSAHPLGCAATLATLDVFESTDVLRHARWIGQIIEKHLKRMAELPGIAAVRGEALVWGIEFASTKRGGTERTPTDNARQFVRDCYLGDSAGNAIHLLGPLAGCVVRLAPPLTITSDQAEFWMDVLYHFAKQMND